MRNVCTHILYIYIYDKVGTKASMHPILKPINGQHTVKTLIINEPRICTRLDCAKRKHIYLSAPLRALQTIKV